MIVAVLGYAMQVAAQTTAYQDSLIELGKTWRSSKNYVIALDQFLKAGGDEAEYEIALTHYYMGKIAMSLSECKTIVAKDNAYSMDANVLMGLCRERQGFDRAAKRIYKKMVGQGSARAAYYYAVMMQKKGHLADAEEMVQKSIRLDKGIPESHFLLSTIMAQKSERFKAMLPLYYYLLINDDEDNQRVAYANLIRLWRRSAKALEILKDSKRQPDKFNDGVERYIEQLATSDSIAQMNGEEQIEALRERTYELMKHLLEVSEENLDFWQVTYTDFFVKLVPRNFVEPYVYYISDVTHHAIVLDYVARNEYLFNEFRLWMEAQE